MAQAALGALLGELLWGRRLGRRALAWGALFGLLPAADVLLYPLLGNARELWWHRGPSHSLPALAAVSYAAACGLGRLWKRERISRLQAWPAVFLLLAGHVGMDCLTLDGAALFWPLEGRRIAAGVLGPADVLFTAPLVVAALGLAVLKDAKPRKSRSKKPAPPALRRRLPRWGLGLAGACLAVAGGLKARATSAFAADLERRGARPERLLTAPARHHFLLWRAVADHGGNFRVGYRSVFEGGSRPVRWTIYPQRPEALAKVAELPATRTLTTLADGWWLARPDVRGAWLGDLRIAEKRTWSPRKGLVDNRLQRAWIIDRTASREPLLPVTARGGEDAARRQARRILGNREAWEAAPRLAGVPGSLPEALATDE